MVVMQNKVIGRIVEFFIYKEFVSFTIHLCESTCIEIKSLLVLKISWKSIGMMTLPLIYSIVEG